MEVWREAALRSLPGLRELILESDSPGDLWMDLVPRFGKEASQEGERLRAGVWDFARWSTLGSGEPKVANACYCHFLEHLHQFGPVVQEWLKVRTALQEVDQMVAASDRLWGKG